jgi:integrase
MMEKRHVLKIRDEKADFPESANARVKALRQVFKWANDADITDRNPAKKVPYLKSNNPNGWHTWTIPEVEQYMARHPIGTKAYKALAIGLYAGVRRGDAVQLGRQMERDGDLHFTEQKDQARNPKHRVLPILPELRAGFDASPSGHLTYIVNEFGKPFTPAGFGNWFRKRCNEAGLHHCSFHGLRKAGATIAANNGATEHQLMAIYGWTTTKQAGLYTKEANRNKLAKDAMHLLIPDQEVNESVPLSGGDAEGGTKKAKKA